MTNRATRWCPPAVGEQPDGAITSVWPTGTHGLDAQLAGRRYYPDTDTDLALMPPATAEYAIALFTRPGDVVLDPDCGAGTTLVEALRAGRHAIGLTAQRRWWRLARANVTRVKATGAPVDGMVLVLDRRPGTIAAAETAGLTGRIDLLLTTLRPTNSTTDPAKAVDRLGSLLVACRPLLRPGGHLVITTPPCRHPVRHELLDLPGQIHACGITAGLAPVARCLALTATLRGRRVITHATLTQRRDARRIEQATGRPSALAAHHTALVFRADPDAAAASTALPAPPPPTRPSWHGTSRTSQRATPIAHAAA